jgi:hypothetical protein
MAKVTHIQDASGSEFTARSGKTFVLKVLNGYEVMNVDDLAMSQDGNLHVMRIPYLRALASVVGIKDGEKVVPFGPIRTEIDVQKWAQTLSASEMEDLLAESGKNYAAKPDSLKNE